jgi:hypothetical protein
MWSRIPSYVALPSWYVTEWCTVPAHALSVMQFCEVTAAKGEAMVAEILNAVAQHAVAGALAATQAV